MHESILLSTRQSGQTLGSIVASARNIYVSACSSEIETVPEILREHRPLNARVTGVFSPMVNRRSYADAELGIRVRTVLLTKALKRDMALGLVDHCPWRYSMIDQWLCAPDRFDTALVMMSPPDAAGNCSLGVQTDFLPSFLHQVERVVGFINPHMPRTTGDAAVPYASLAAVVDHDAPLPTMVDRAADETAIAIARRIVELVPDNAAVQFGVGQIPSQVIAALSGHRGLSVHSGVVDDNILALEASGALDPDVPIVTGTAVGTKALYDAIDGNDRFSFRRVGHTHSHPVISGKPRFMAINSVLQADLLGQISSEFSGGKLVATPGGLPDFVRGALASEGGRSIVAVRARTGPGHSNGIVALLDRPSAATVSGNDADVLVTEFGTAELRGLTFDERAAAVIKVAAPEDRETLESQWSQMRSSFF